MLQMEGVPKRCFTLVTADGKKHKLCYYFNVWTDPTDRDHYPKHPTPDPGPALRIEGVDPAVLRELEALDTIQWISQALSGETQASVREAVERGLATIQRQLPAFISLEP